MEQVGRSDAWTTSLAADRVGFVIEELAARIGMRLTRPSPNTFVMNHGSNPRARAFGVWFEPSSLPSKAHIEISAAPGGTRLTVRIEETWPNYLEEKSRTEYAALFDQWLQALREAIPALPDEPGIQGHDIAGELARLAEVHAQGVITDDEFSAAKAAVLARPDTAGSGP
ncbi:MAG TPA: SHOCT domain-containing protein [Gaiellaceae bacterium]